MFGQITFGDRLRKIARENGERELACYRYSLLSDEEKDRHAEISKEIEELHDAREVLLKEGRFEEANENLKKEMDLWHEMTDLMVGEKKGA